MEEQIVQINFQYTGSAKEFEAAAVSVAELFSEIPGLLWKIWLLNKEKREAGGIYLFSDTEHADAYRQSLLFKKILLNPGYSNFSVKQFSVLEMPGIITNAPIEIRQHLN